MTATKNNDVAGSILTESAETVTGPREETHGNKRTNFRNIADLWNAYIGLKFNNVTITPADVAQMMALLKMARTISGKPTRDHGVDQAGYSAIACELALFEQGE